MADHATHPSITERAERALWLFRERYAKGSDRELYEALESLVLCHEDLKRSMDYLKIQMEEMRRGVGHLETTGAVPHTRRRG